ncbi:Seven in absentia protein family [Musa troglodytarum]|uniref:RING-type E3 ubiquitin transferase n=1 Tax=Musa troglodytarum TaxID=320322 RepID=A0A9E7G615_9LILI|nr:Seven in absentia protein family [Musa troglodytarum]
MEKYTGKKRGHASATECSESRSKSKSKSKVEHPSTAPSEAAGSQKSRNSNGTDVGTGSIGLRVLECVVCFGPLLPPLYQCRNGHVACHPCHEKLHSICHTCKCLLSYARNLALENIMESVMIPCPHAPFGCKETVDYIKPQEHAEKCTYAPFSCLFPECTYAASYEELMSHATQKHQVPTRSFDDGSAFYELLGFQSIFLMLRETNICFLLRNSGDISSGRAFSVVSNRSCLRGTNWLYDLSLWSLWNGVEFRLCDAPVEQLDNQSSPETILFVPQKYFTHHLQSLRICIRKIS